MELSFLKDTLLSTPNSCVIFVFKQRKRRRNSYIISKKAL